MECGEVVLRSEIVEHYEEGEMPMEKVQFAISY